MRRDYFLIVSAAGEVGIGLALLCVPSIPLELLLGVSSVAPEALLVGRVAGAALFALGVAGWFGRSDQGGPARTGLLVGFLIYDGAVAALLACAGLGLGMVGVVLWPTVALHAAMTVWCLGCLGNRPGGREAGRFDSPKLQEKQP